MTKDKGSDMLFRLCNIEDTVKHIELESMLLKPKLNALKEQLESMNTS